MKRFITSPFRIIFWAIFTILMMNSHTVATEYDNPRNSGSKTTGIMLGAVIYFLISWSVWTFVAYLAYHYSWIIF